MLAGAGRDLSLQWNDLHGMKNLFRCKPVYNHPIAN
jgi:hypothetical protein